MKGCGLKKITVCNIICTLINFEKFPKIISLSHSASLKSLFFLFITRFKKSVKSFLV